jgi:hypothetical protein
MSSVVLALIMALLCAATLTPAQVPVDVRTQLNVSVFPSLNASLACCLCKRPVDAPLLVMPVIPPVGWNLTALSLRIIGGLPPTNQLALEFASGAPLVDAGSVQAAPNVREVCASNSSCVGVTRNISDLLDVSAAARAAFDYNGNNSLRLLLLDENETAVCVSEIQLALEFVNLGPYVERLVPQIGPLHGGTDVLVLGVNLREQDMPACSFDGVLVDAHPVVNADPGTALRCRAPPAPANVSTTAQVEFRVVVGREHGRADVFPYPPSPALTFLYYESPSLTDMAPQRGAPDAATPVTINGTNFFVGASQLSCRFGAVVVNAVRLSDDALQCTAPPLGEHTRVDVTVPIAVSLNGYDFVVAQHFNFTYDAAADELETLTSQLEAIVVVVVVVASATVICLAVALYRRRSAAGAARRRRRRRARRRRRREPAVVRRQPRQRLGRRRRAPHRRHHLGARGPPLRRQRAADGAPHRQGLVRRGLARQLARHQRRRQEAAGVVPQRPGERRGVQARGPPAAPPPPPEHRPAHRRHRGAARRAADRRVHAPRLRARPAAGHGVAGAGRRRRRRRAAVAPPRLSVNDNSDEVVVAGAAPTPSALASSAAPALPQSPSSAALAAKAELAPLPMRLRVSMLCDAARGMLYLHSCRPVVVHRDLKPRNLLVSGDWRVKLCDFGLSTVVSQSRNDGTMTACGTPAYTAPEILRNFKYCFAASDHQLLTNRGFLFLDEVLAAVDVGSRVAHDNQVHVRDWRGLQFASYDAMQRRARRTSSPRR